MLESTIEKHLVSQVKSLNGKIYKWCSPSNNGVPDRILFLNGQVWFIELKRPGAKRQRLQVKFAEDIKPFTNNYAVLDSLEKIDKLIVEIMIKL